MNLLTFIFYRQSDPFKDVNNKMLRQKSSIDIYKYISNNYEIGKGV